MTTKETMEEGAEASQQAENEAKKEIEETGEIPPKVISNGVLHTCTI